MNLIFDFDGTICDSLPTVVDIINPYLKKTGKKPITKNEIREIGIMDLIKKRRFPKILIPYFLIYGRWRYRKLITSLKTTVNLAPILRQLQKENVIGILTSNSVKNVEGFIDHNDLSDIFEFVHSESTYFNKSKKIRSVLKKYSLDTEDTLYIGDETRDINAAKKAGLKTVAVTWGYEDESVLTEVKPDYIVRKPKELLGIIDRN